MPKTALRETTSARDIAAQNGMDLKATNTTINAIAGNIKAESREDVGNMVRVQFGRFLQFIETAKNETFGQSSREDLAKIAASKLSISRVNNSLLDACLSLYLAGFDTVERLNTITVGAAIDVSAQAKNVRVGRNLAIGLKNVGFIDGKVVGQLFGELKDSLADLDTPLSAQKRVIRKALQVNGYDAPIMTREEIRDSLSYLRDADRPEFDAFVMHFSTAAATQNGKHSVAEAIEKP